MSPDAIPPGPVAAAVLAFATGGLLGAVVAGLWLHARWSARVRAAEARAEVLERLGGVEQGVESRLRERQQAIEALVRPLSESLEGYRLRTAELEERRLRDLGRVDRQLGELAAQTARVASALHSPHARGRWGEMTLRRTAELAGLHEHCDFEQQRAVEGGAARPDLRVRLPAGREIVVDAKTPLDGYLDAIEAPSEAERQAALDRHADHVKRHVEALAARRYPDRVVGALEFVVLFLPHDALIGAACERQPDLVDHALGRGVVLATPSSLYALLKAVAQGWREERLATHAAEIVGLAEEMQQRLAGFADHFGRVGTALERTVAQFNAALGSWESRVLPQSRRLEELGAGRRSLPEPAPVDTLPRRPRA